MLSYDGIDEAELIHGLYHGTRSLGLNAPAGIIDRLHGGHRVTVESVRADLAKFPSDEDRMRLDYYLGRPLKLCLDLKAKTFEERLYDRDAGAGAAARVIEELRSKVEQCGALMLTADTITDEQIRELLRKGQLLSTFERRMISTALNDGRMTLSARMIRNARARCAEIINAREASKAVR